MLNCGGTFSAGAVATRKFGSLIGRLHHVASIKDINVNVCGRWLVNAMAAACKHLENSFGQFQKTTRVIIPILHVQIYLLNASRCNAIGNNILSPSPPTTLLPRLSLRSTHTAALGALSAPLANSIYFLGLR